MNMAKEEDSNQQAQEDRQTEIMKSHGIKPTAMRLLVYRQLEHARHPLSLKELEERMVTAERSTIFRTLTLLHERHLIHAIEDGSGAMKYELCLSDGDRTTDEDQHPHFYCEQCRRTFCLHDMPLPPVPLPAGFQATATNFLIKGICAECHATNKQCKLSSK